MKIHPTAIVSSRAELDEGVSIGPYCVIGDQVSIGADSEVHSHVVIEGHVKIGSRTSIYPFALIGTPPQDLSYRGERRPDSDDRHTLDLRVNAFF